MKIIHDFKEFAFKGNVLDMAVGVIIGSAFGKIVTSVVNDLIMPIFAYLTSGMKFEDLKIVLDEKTGSAIMYGNFISSVVDFLIIALSIFLFIRVINKAKSKLVKEEELPPEPEVSDPTAEELLTEIRDILSDKTAE